MLGLCGIRDLERFNRGAMLVVHWLARRGLCRVQCLLHHMLLPQLGLLNRNLRYDARLDLRALHSDELSRVHWLPGLLRRLHRRAGHYSAARSLRVVLVRRECMLLLYHDLLLLHVLRGEVSRLLEAAVGMGDFARLDRLRDDVCAHFDLFATIQILPIIEAHRF